MLSTVLMVIIEQTRVSHTILCTLCLWIPETAHFWWRSGPKKIFCGGFYLNLATQELDSQIMQEIILYKLSNSSTSFKMRHFREWSGSMGRNHGLEMKSAEKLESRKFLGLLKKRLHHIQGRNKLWMIFSRGSDCVKILLTLRT